MDNSTTLLLLKKDLQLLTTANDDYLLQLIELAKTFINREGIKLDDTLEINMIVIQYAAYLFRKRAGENTAMPRYLRYELNNILFSQKGNNDVNV